MANQVTNYKCPACTGPLHFVGTSGQLECDYCGSVFSVEEIEKLHAEEDRKAAEAKAEADEKAAREKEAEAKQTDMPDEYADKASAEEDWIRDGMKAYNCPSCGAELVCDETTAATSCPYCGNPTIVPGQFSGMLKPEFIIPFKLDKEAAVEALKQHYKGKPFLPKAFSDQNHIEEIKGVYVPFWLYDGKVEGSAEFSATRTRSYRSGQYEITETSHYKCDRAGSISFAKVPADASSKMPDDLMDSIEPYDYSELKSFSMAYLPGYLADKYDVSSEEDEERARLRADNSLIDYFTSDIRGYSTVTKQNSNTKLKIAKRTYALMPVWLLSTKWKDENYLFAMNGQTGKLVGNLPTDKGKFWGAFAGIAIAAEVLMALISILM